jgi:hypothetical protein
VTLEVFQDTKSVELDLLILPSHTSHALQLLDVAVFKPFKHHFREYRDLWTSRNLDQPAKKTTLVQWVSLALQKALSSSNIRKGFNAIGIYRLKRLAIQAHMQPSESYQDLKHGSKGGEPAAAGQTAYKEGGHGGDSTVGQGCEEIGKEVVSPSEGSNDTKLEADLA